MELPTREFIHELITVTSKLRGYEDNGEDVTDKVMARLKEVETAHIPRDTILDILEDEINLAFPRIKHNFGSILSNGS